MDFDKLYKEFYDQIKRTAKSYLRNEEDALDVTQDTFLKAYESLDSYDGSTTLSTWLTTICINTCKDKLRQRKRDKKRFTSIHEGNEHLLEQMEDKTDPMLTLDAEEAENRIMAAFLGLPDNLSDAVLYRYSYELSYKEIAEKLNVNVNTAKTWVRRGREQLLQVISPR